MAFVAAGLIVSTFWTGAYDVPVSQEPLFLLGVKVIFGLFFDQPLLVQGVIKLLGCRDVARPSGSAVVVEGKFELIKKIFIDLMKEVDVLFGRSMCHVSAECDRNAMLIRAADIEDVIAHKPLEPGIAIPWQVGPCNVAKVERAIRIGQS